MIKPGRNEYREAALARLSEMFRGAMLERLLEKHEDGWEGWADRNEMDKFRGGLRWRIVENVLKGHWVDVANLAMFAWNFEQD